MILSKFSSYYKRYEKYISPISLIYGFILTSLTLTRVDLWLENFWIVVHLLIASFGILAITFFENRTKQKNLPQSDQETFHFYLTLIIQFAFGGLFSTFFIFYLRSSSVADSWFFLLILLILLVGNELWKKHYQRLVFQISILYLALFLFFIFLLPVLFHRLGADLFISSGLLSLILVTLFTFLLRKIAKEKFKNEHPVLRTCIIVIFLLMNFLYFTNIIPPIPLSIKQAGVYHQIIRVEGGDYKVAGEEKKWQDYFTFYPVFHKQSGESVFAFCSVFSPVAFDTTIVHQWQYYDETKRIWSDSDKITLPISGGREDGYRTFSEKTIVTPGLWRVKVMTVRGQVLGKVNFKVEAVTTKPNLVNKTL